MNGVLWLITFLADWQLISCLKVSIITVLWWLHRAPLVSRGMTLSLVWEKMLDWVHKLRDLCGQGPQTIINSRNEAGRGYELVLAPVCSHAPRCGLICLTCQLNLQQNALYYSNYNKYKDKSWEITCIYKCQFALFFSLLTYYQDDSTWSPTDFQNRSSIELLYILF